MFKKVKKTSQKKMSCCIDGYGSLDFTLKRSSARRTISLSVDAKAEMTVSSPFYVVEKDIFEFISEKSQWIEMRLKEAERNKDYIESKSFVSGSEFLFLGKKFTMFVFEKEVKRARISFDGTAWNIIVPFGLAEEERKNLSKKKLIKWYRDQALEILGGRLFQYARDMEVEPKKISICTQKRMWGCCDYRAQVIRLNWQIIMSPMRVIDYVIVHELCHLTVPNHSAKFWNEVSKFMPDYNEQKRWLKENALDMVLPQ